jgi:HSP20 family protein
MSTLTKWNPFREMEAIQNRFNTLFGRPLSGGGEETMNVMDWSPLVDVAEDDKEYTITAELPDIKKEDVKVTVEDGALHISGERRFEKEQNGRKYHRIERAYGIFDRVFMLPEGARSDEIQAKFHDGLLEVHLPKTEKVKPKTLEVEVT